ncbi:hypothetical protein [uncultured Croceitalea sp.]|uniref:hypothetical protein n=1 Tax=uncultured Croceitalea sp. TaxID=1798908 RepID=UPI0033066D45
MKPVVLDIMKYKILIVFFLVSIVASLAQTKQERELRIAEDELPENVLQHLKDYITSAKRLRFYKEQDGTKSSYEVKFKKDKLHYSVEFDENGTLEDVEFIIKPTDIPEDTYLSITAYLNKTFKKPRVKKIQQQYLAKDGTHKNVLKNAFQNLLIQQLNYELIISSKDDSGFNEYELTFNAEGKHLLTRKAVKSKYDHVLYP